jgi:hypothetical protein
VARVPALCGRAGAGRAERLALRLTLALEALLEPLPVLVVVALE